MLMLHVLSPKSRYKPLFKKSVFLTIGLMSIFMRCMSSFLSCFLASRDFCRINLIFSSSLEKFLTMLFTLDSLSASLSPHGMMLEIIASFVVDLTVFASAINSWQLTLEIHPYKASCIVTKK